MIFRIPLIAFLYTILPVFFICAGAKTEQQIPPTNPLTLQEIYGNSDSNGNGGVYSDPANLASEISLYSSRQNPDRAEATVRALAISYPDRIKEPEFIDGDWSIEVYGERFFYAGGRFLPASLRHRAEEFNPLTFYGYSKDLPPWVPPTPEESERMREQENLRQSRTATQRTRSPLFFDTLWRARNHEESWDRVKQIRFLGHTVMIHYSILTELSLVEEQILKASRTSSAVRQWIQSLNTVEGWSWRSVASSGSRSFHSYGVAIDLLPKSLGGLQTYWFWTAQYTDWWTVPYTARFHPPQEVIDAFESFGFVWGGKWRYYDTMHFEYRPEVFALNNIPLMNLRDLR